MHSCRCALIQTHWSEGIPAVLKLIWLLDLKEELCWGAAWLSWSALSGAYRWSCVNRSDVPLCWLLLKLFLLFLWDLKSIFLMQFSEDNLNSLFLKSGVGVLLDQFNVKKEPFRAILVLYFTIPFSSIKAIHELNLWDPICSDSLLPIFYLFSSHLWDRKVPQEGYSKRTHVFTPSSSMPTLVPNKSLCNL